MKPHPPARRRSIKEPKTKQTLAFRLPARMVKAIRLAAQVSGMDMTQIAEAVFRRHLRAAVREHVLEQGWPQLESLDKEIAALLQVDPLSSAAAPAPAPPATPASGNAPPASPPPPSTHSPTATGLLPDTPPKEDNTQ